MTASNMFADAIHKPTDCWWCWMFVIDRDHEPTLTPGLEPVWLED